MPPPEPAGLPLLPYREAFAPVVTAGGAVILALSVVVEANWVPAAVGSLLMAPLFGLSMWLINRRQLRRWLPRLEVVAPRPETASLEQRSRRRGRMVAVVLLLVEGVVVLGFAWLFDDPEIHIIGGIVLGAGGWMYLEVRDLRRWQTGAGAELWMREGSGPWQTVRNQAPQRLLVVPR